MKRVDLIRLLESQGCRLLRDRGKHSVFVKTTSRNGSLLLLALAFLVAAWVVEAVGSARVSRLNLPQGDTDIDIPEALAIDSYIARHYLPYISATLALEWLAFGALCWAGRRGRLRFLGIIVGIALLGSGGWHGLHWLATWVFVTPAHF